MRTAHATVVSTYAGIRETLHRLSHNCSVLLHRRGCAGLARNEELNYSAFQLRSVQVISVRAERSRGSGEVEACGLETAFDFASLCSGRRV